MREPTCHLDTSLSLNGIGDNNVRGPTSKDVKSKATTRIKNKNFADKKASL